MFAAILLNFCELVRGMGCHISVNYTIKQ